jgi:alginate O-acetyltransferase complex protein AlgI
VVFSAPIFLFGFLPLVLLLVAPLRRAQQNLALLVASIVFYLWGAGSAVATIAYVTVASWLLARAVDRLRGRNRLLGLWAVCLLVTLPLLRFKYAPVVSAFVSGSVDPVSLLLPLGISFFTFHALSYLIDVYHQRVHVEPRLDDYALYLFLFPHQIAGPIVRYGEIYREIKGRLRPRLDDVAYGMSRFGWGLAKKVLVGDPAGQVAAAAWDSLHAGTLTAPGAWLGAFAFTVQIYFDFSGYSDMAIGLARVFGFHFPENFAGPYRVASATEFWRRWHMTLSRWFRDYVYIPLGGSRHGRPREYAALLATFALTSLWHGATWSYLVWGGLWSALLVIERITGLRHVGRFRAARRLGMALVIMLVWVPFRSPTLTDAMDFWRTLVAGPWGWPSPEYLVTLTPVALAALVVGLIPFVLPDSGHARVFDRLVLAADRRILLPGAVAVGATALLLGCVFALWSSFSPFLYFQF